MMFTLVVYPNGQSILATEEPLTREQVDEIKELFKQWKASNEDVLVVGRMKVMTSLDLELDLPRSKKR